MMINQLGEARWNITCLHRAIILCNELKHVIWLKARRT